MLIKWYKNTYLHVIIFYITFLYYTNKRQFIGLQFLSGELWSINMVSRKTKWRFFSRLNFICILQKWMQIYFTDSLKLFMKTRNLKLKKYFIDFIHDLLNKWQCTQTFIFDDPSINKGCFWKGIYEYTIFYYSH